MINIARDPKGYYIALGIAEDADGAAIKSAFRSRAKRLHPDFNPSPVAAKQFHRLHEAYATLSDPRKRAAYDRPWKGRSSGGTKSEAPRTETPRPDPAASTTSTRTAESARQAYARRTELIIPVACRCGQVTAQPRFVIYDMVWGRMRRVHRRSLSGVYCRSCADRTAIRASLVTWLAGWWAWPDGPRETIRALLNNMRGGRKPVDRNTRLLMRQARAFQKRGDMDLARSAAEQARQFARNPVLYRQVESLLTELGPGTGRVLKDRWAKPGWAPMVQILPLALTVGLIAAVVTLFLPRIGTAYHRATPAIVTHKEAPAPVARARETPAPQQTYVVAMDKATVRTGPANGFQEQTYLKRGANVTAIEVDPRGDWLRVILPDGTTGFIALADLRPAPSPTAATATKTSPPD